MLILGVDTSGRDGSLALGRGDVDSFDLLEIVSLAGGMYSTQIMPAIAGMLERQGASKTDLQAFAVASGPGSFTGLRVGLSVVKGLAEVLHKPIATASVLEALAEAAHDDGPTITAMDAARREVFVGHYDVVGSRAKCLREVLMTQLDFSHYLENNPDAQLITPDTDIAEMARFHIHATRIERPRADAYARLGLRKILAGETVAADALDANYIRRTDAELLLKPSL